jgi:hypothetical protein
VTVPPTAASGAGALTPFQVEAARLFFSLPTSDGFLLAGGAALLVQHLTVRPTQDRDFFTRHPGAVAAAAEEFRVAAEGRGWRVEDIQTTPTFARLVVHGDEDLVVDLALDSPPGMPATASVVGPTFAPAELAARKLLALYDRAEARDFTDVFVLAVRFGKGALLSGAKALDAGLDGRFLAERLGTLARFDDSELPVAREQAAEVRSFFAEWQRELFA